MSLYRLSHTALRCASRSSSSLRCATQSIPSLSFKQRQAQLQQQRQRAPSAFARLFSSDSSSSSPTSSSSSSSPSSAIVSSPAPHTSYHSVVVSLFGPDRSGIVADMSDVVSELHGNIEESRMTVLGDDFAVIVLIAVPTSTTAQQVKARLEQHLSPQFVVAVRETEAGSKHPGFLGPVRVLQLAGEGPDQPNVVNRISKLLRRHNISIRDLDSDTSSAPFAGYKNFLVKAFIAVPTRVNLEEFYAELQELGDEMGFDLSLADPTKEEEESGATEQKEGGEQGAQEGGEGAEQAEEEDSHSSARREADEMLQDPKMQALLREAEERIARRSAEKASKSASSATASLSPSERSARLAEMEAAMRSAAAKRAAAVNKPITKTPPPRR